ncbi:hypothetical protein LXA43DRAFT_1066736 [Ganoderma leucocontextum]|nr:hypothetical protein LXA43DRAFT_1066736 [Ganoderma leucocontextum]
MASDNTTQANPSRTPSAAGPSTVHSPAPGPTVQISQEPSEPDMKVSIAMPKLQANKRGNPIPGFVDAFVGIVAAQAYTAQEWECDIVVTTPNANWVPEFAVAHSEITTFSDGRWGRHEYSRWPQQFAREVFHTHCIPAKARPNGPREILWRTLSLADWKPDDCGVPGIGFLDKALQNNLVQEAEDTISRYFACSDVVGIGRVGWNEMGRFLVVCLQHTMDRLRSIPTLPGIIISLAAHVQRLTLELSGLIEWLKVVFKRVQSAEDYSWLVLDVVGAYTGDPSVAQMLHRAGIPVWLQRQRNTRLEVYKVVTATDIPADFSQVPSYPRLVLAKRDLSGALNLPGEWQRAMAAIVRRQLCESQLPKLLEEERDGTLPPAKRLREGVMWAGSDSSSLGTAKPVFITRASQHAKTLQHELLPAPPASSSHSTPGPSKDNSVAKKPSRRTRRRQEKAQSNQANGFATIPSRQYYASLDLSISSTWASTLSAVSPLPQPQVSVKYFFAPPSLLDTLEGFKAIPEKTARYLHHWVSIRTFCRVRLFDSTIAGRPLTIAEWRDALWGDYNINDPPEGSSGPLSGRPKVRHELQRNVHRLFGQGGSLPSYHMDACPQFGNTLVTLEMARSNSSLRSSVVWDTHETNWRCELLALDALMVGSNQWPELNRWMRESLVSQVWGSGTSGIDVVPSSEPQGHVFCWVEPPQEGWEECRRYLKSFVEVLGRWEGLPSELRRADQRVMACDANEYARVLRAAVSFYVRTFVAKYERLPVPPLRTQHCRMGAMKWRAQELIMLENLAASEDGKKQLKQSNTDRRDGRNYWFRNAANLFVMKYREEFAGCFDKETTVEFAYRQQRQPHAKLEPYSKETEAEKDERLSTVNKRIESWLKRIRLRRTQALPPLQARPIKAGKLSMFSPGNLASPAHSRVLFVSLRAHQRVLPTTLLHGPSQSSPASHKIWTRTFVFPVTTIRRPTGGHQASPFDTPSHATSLSSSILNKAKCNANTFPRANTIMMAASAGIPNLNGNMHNFGYAANPSTQNALTGQAASSSAKLARPNSRTYLLLEEPQNRGAGALDLAVLSQKAYQARPLRSSASISPHPRPPALPLDSNPSQLHSSFPSQRDAISKHL